MKSQLTKVSFAVLLVIVLFSTSISCKPKEAPAANLSTLKDPVNGFEIGYPAAWKCTSNASFTPEPQQGLPVIAYHHFKEGPIKSQVGVYVLESTEKKSMDYFFTNTKVYSDTGYLPLLSRTEKKVNGLNAVVFGVEYEKPILRRKYELKAVIELPDQKYVYLDAGLSESFEREQAIEMFNQIVSSLRAK